MRFLIALLLGISRSSRAYPRSTIAFFLLLATAGFAVTPFIRISTNLLSGVGESNPIITVTKENTTAFGEQDSLIVVLQFPDPPSEARLPFVKGVAESLEKLPGVKRVRHQYLDPDNEDQVALVLKNFLLGMNERERDQIRKIFSPEVIEDALRRTRNRLFLTENPYIQHQLLQDPLELGQFVGESMKKRIGAVSIGDIYLLIASPDSTTYLIQVTPEFPSLDILRGKELLTKLRELLPAHIAELLKTVPGAQQFNDVKWHLTGKLVFQQESDQIFDEEMSTIVLVSFGLVVVFLLIAYRDGWSAAILMTPIVAAIGPNYAVMYLCFEEINPVVMAGTGLLIGMGAEYGEHLWGRFREEIDRGMPHIPAIDLALERTGPPVVLGAFTGIAAFLCLCLSDQPALIQFGYFGASGLALVCTTTLFLFPALVALGTGRKKDHFPRIRLEFWGLASWFTKAPGVIVAVSALLVLVSIAGMTRISYEKDLFKVFLARTMTSLHVSERISRKFQLNFTTPMYLSFDTGNLDEGLTVQRHLDAILEGLMDKGIGIAAFDSISYLMSPESVRQENIKTLSEILQRWPDLAQTFNRRLKGLDLSEGAQQEMRQSFDTLGSLVKEAQNRSMSEAASRFADLERSWYLAKIKGKYRFLTHIRYSSDIRDPDRIRAVNSSISEAVQGLPVKVYATGSRQLMETILMSLVSELFKLGLYAFLSVVVTFFVVFPNPRGVGLCLIPMVGAFCITLGVLGFSGFGVPFSIVCVAPLIFGFGIHNGMHVVMGSIDEEGGSVARATARVTPRAMVTSLTVIMGFVSMVTSQHYAMEFLGSAMVIGMLASVPLTLVTLPALLMLLERQDRNAPICRPKSPIHSSTHTVVPGLPAGQRKKAG